MYEMHNILHLIEDNFQLDHQEFHYPYQVHSQGAKEKDLTMP
jgi:hypothetical protein